ncbi:uncharacterized protein LOC110677110 [Aedes aegypti]|uniref:G domain-containing protein n=1 Tax=Aedes aegypti TaxID=7159 RepID=A0A6I8U254_AEDAE|nr:uncharacterized protein LOC110677110 [Aedes aegypti]XP_021703490.1 uncharacterized protein LOC110677110 [Aedes aegypti]
MDSTSKNIPEYNVIIIGETGAGKSTFINYLTNFFKDGSPGQLKLSIPSKHYPATEGLNHSEKNVADTSKSQTSQCNQYIFRKDEFDFGFTDTPGLCDTEETLNDEKNILKIMEAVVEHGTLAAIVIVMNGTQSRATSILRHVLNEMKNMIPDSCLGNIIVVLTNCNRASANFDVSQLKPWKVLGDNLFHMNNSILSKPEATWKNDSSLKKYIEDDWHESMKTIQQMIYRLKHLGCQATTAFKKLHDKRNQIRSNLCQILCDLDNLQKLQNVLCDAESNKREISEDIKKYSNYKQSHEVEYTDVEKSLFLNQICRLCSRVCYEDWVAQSSLRGRLVKRLEDCLIFVKGIAIGYLSILGQNNCHKCDCPDHEHYHSNMKPVKKMKTIEKIVDEIKASHDHHMQRKVEAENKISGFRDDIETIKNKLHEKEAAVGICCNELKEVCSQFNLVKELGGIIEIMKRNANNLRSIPARNDANEKIAKISQVISELSGVQSEYKNI